MKFRKKPVVIEAQQYVLGCPMKDVCSTSHYGYRGDAHVHTLEGILDVQHGDWIIHGIKNEVYPCKPDIFEATYERVEP